MAMYKRNELGRQNQSPAFDVLHPARTPTPYSEIYRCEACGVELVSAEDQPLPVVMHRRHPTGHPMMWRLVVYAN
ncbi:MAG TPA: hypothetical protein VFS02_21785 [Telluria sp.]|nr:hypothetical protein [Telluria sp.]